MNNQNCTSLSAESDCATVFVAIELSRSSWVVAAHTPPVDKIRLHKLAAGDVEGLLALIARQRARAEKALGRPVQVAAPGAGRAAARASPSAASRWAAAWPA